MSQQPHKMAGFTPGPWDVAKNGEGVMTVLVRNADGNPYKHIANICWADTEGGQPDANLIAAAPALYEALEALASDVGKMPADLTSSGALLGSLIEAKMALAQARGEAA